MLYLSSLSCHLKCMRGVSVLSSLLCKMPLRAQAAQRAQHAGGGQGRDVELEVRPQAEHSSPLKDTELIMETRNQAVGWRITA